MKIKAKNPKVASMKLCVPVDGVIDIDFNGVADVSPKCAAHLVVSTNDWDYLKKKVEEITDEVEANDENDEINAEISERQEFENGLKTMQLNDMNNMAKEAGYPEEEWSKFTSKKMMMFYLLKKFDEVNLKDSDKKED
jgi:signal recognition particle receptor subunit beta